MNIFLSNQHSSKTLFLMGSDAPSCVCFSIQLCSYIRVLIFCSLGQDLFLPRTSSDTHGGLSLAMLSELPGRRENLQTGAQLVPAGYSARLGQQVFDHSHISGQNRSGLAGGILSGADWEGVLTAGTLTWETDCSRSL